MKRVSILVLFVSVLSGCAAAQTTEPAGQSQPAGQTQPGETQPADQTQPSTAGGAGGASLVDAALQVTDVCTLMPMDLAASIVPDASQPQSQQFPPRCTVSNGTSVLEITIGAYDAVDPLVPNEPVAGLGAAAYLQKQTPDNAYLKIILDPNGGAVYVEVAGHDGEDHGNDAIAVAQRVLAALQPA